MSGKDSSKDKDKLQVSHTIAAYLFEFMTERKVVGTIEDLKTGKTTKEVVELKSLLIM